MHSEKITNIKKWTDNLVSIFTTRSRSLRFESGQFTMIGFEKQDKTKVLRAYSYVNPTWSDYLEFLGIMVPGGELSNMIEKSKPGDYIFVNPKPSGNLILNSLTSGRNLYMFSTGTGLAPFLSVIHDPDVYEKFKKIILIHTCRSQKEHVYKEYLKNQFRKHPYLGDFVNEQFIYLPTTTKEKSEYMGRSTDLIKQGLIEKYCNTEKMDSQYDRVMVCGNPNMVSEMRNLFSDWKVGSLSEPGSFIFEKAFVEKE